ncbi:hypothetical protein PC120_g2824 [Phytophthora cactorum]|nr:hypothetical protein PC120_g2824 [Phytophthora cactorum]
MCNPIEGCFSVLKARINNFLSLSHEGEARVWSLEVIKEALETVPATERTSYRAILAATRIHRTTLARPTANKDGLQRVTGSVLTSDQMHKRIEFALSFVENAFGTFRFNGMNDTIHIDGK